jgi:hypothetical protein
MPNVKKTINKKYKVDVSWRFGVSIINVRNPSMSPEKTGNGTKTPTHHWAKKSV